MHTLSSASRTCIASASAVECTATVAMPSSLQARSTRSAISPRLAIRILSNISDRHEYFLLRHARSHAGHPRLAARVRERRRWPGQARHDGGWSLNNHQRLAVLDRVAVLEQDLRHLSGARRGD